MPQWTLVPLSGPQPMGGQGHVPPCQNLYGQLGQAQYMIKHIRT